MDIPYSEGTPTDLMAGPFRLNRCYYMDCLEALPLIPNKYFDLCLTDPPFNVEYKGQEGKIKEFQVKYPDTNKNYYDWCFRWFEEVKKITNGQVIFPGNPNIFEWIKYQEPSDIAFHYKKNGHGIGQCFYLVKHDTILLYGSFNGKLRQSVLEYYLLNGFLRKHKWKHPCPNISSLYADILLSLKSKNVIDLFLGSGTTAQSAESLGIPWLGFEIMEEYRSDIEKRIALGIKERNKPKQVKFI